MSTRSRIGILQPDGSVRSIYVHSGGYLDEVGLTLQRSYSDPSPEGDALRGALLDLGALSILGDKLVPDPDRPHTFLDPQEGVCLAYHRDRKDEAGPAVSVHGKGDWPDTWQAYEYLWESGAWSWRRTRLMARQWRPLAESLMPFAEGL